jgi:hypothetical protein
MRNKADELGRVLAGMKEGAAIEMVTVEDLLRVLKGEVDELCGWFEKAKEVREDWERLAKHLHGVEDEREKGRGDGYEQCARKLKEMIAVALR